MERIAAILAIFVLLMNGRHVERRLPQPVQAVAVTLTPVPLDSSNPGRTMLGPLRYLGGWVLTDPQGLVGGISSLHGRRSGGLVLLNDTGEWLRLTPGTGRRPALFGPLPALLFEMGAPKWSWDTESITVDPRDGRTWVGFELTQRICRYDPALRQVEGCVAPTAIQPWPESTGMESLQRLPDGRFVAIAEQYPGPNGAANEVLLFPGDPLDPMTRAPVRLGYEPPLGYLPTDALWLGKGRLLVLNRRVTLGDGFTAVLTLVDAGPGGRLLQPGRVLRGRVLARFARPLLHDNFEALGLTYERGRAVLWIASDDNHLFFQRSLLLRFALPRSWAAPDEVRLPE